MNAPKDGRRLRRAVLAGGVLLVFVAILAAGVLRALHARDSQRRAYPLVEGTLALDALEDRVTVHRDARGVPHVFASGERDALVALGFVHAQDRLSQMLWLRQRAHGRAAEVLGEEAVEADLLARTVGFAALARAQLPRLEPFARMALDAYAVGVNARMARIGSGESGAPLAVARLGLALDPWQPEDSLAIFKLHAFLLGSSIEAVLLNEELIQALGPVAATRFFPGAGLGDAQVPPPDATAWSAAPGADALRRGLGLLGLRPGSSAFVLGGAHTQSGRPMLAVDHHLPASLPAWLHLDHVRGGALDVAGATLPGVPVFWSGHNARVAWGAVAAGAVVTDLYKERLEAGRPDHYFDGREWRVLATRAEKLLVRGSEPIELVVGATHHGPLLPGREPAEALALAWTGARVGEPSGIGSLLDVARSRDARELVEALASHREPVLAVVYADADGLAGLQVAGWVPHRQMSAGLTTLEGRARLHDWTVPVPFDSLPAAQLLDGAGWIVAADASLAPRARAPIDWLWNGGARSARIESLLRQAARTGPIDLRALAALQTDVGSPRALRIVAAIRDLLRASDAPIGPQAAELVRILEAWDGNASERSQGAAAYHVLLEPLARALLPQPLDDALWQRYVALPHADPEALLEALLDEAGAAAAEGGEPARRLARTLREGLREAWLRLSYRLGPNRERWTWGGLHPIRFRPMAGLDSVLSEWSIGPRPYAGTSWTVLAGAYDARDPFEVRMASTARLAFDTGSLDQSLAALAPGQSEHPGHRHFDDQLAGWLAGHAGLLATGTLLVEETSVARLALEPVR